MQPAMVRGGDYTLSPRDTENVFAKETTVLDPESEDPLLPDERERIANARRVSTVGLVQTYGPDATVAELPQEIQNDILRSLRPLNKKTDEKARSRSVLATKLADLHINYSYDNPLVPTKKNEREERIQNLTALANLQPENATPLPDFPESVKADLMAEAELLQSVGKIIEHKDVSKYGTSPEEDAVAFSDRVRFADYFNEIDRMVSSGDVDRRIERTKRAYQESRDPFGFGDATRTRNEVTGELESGLAGQLDDPLVESLRGPQGTKVRMQWSAKSKEKPDISYEALRLLAKNSGRNDLTEEADAIYNSYLADDEARGRSQASAHLIEELGLNQRTIKPFQMETRESATFQKIPRWDVQAPVPSVSSPLPDKYATKILTEFSPMEEQYPVTHDYGLFTPEGLKRDLQVGELANKEMLQEIGEGTYRNDVISEDGLSETRGKTSLQFDKLQKNQKLKDLLKSIKKGTFTSSPEQQKQYASIVSDEAVSLIGLQAQMTASLAEIDINNQIERFDEQATISGNNMNNLPDNYRELQAAGKLTASDVFDYDEDSGDTRIGISRGQTGLVDRHRQTVIDTNVSTVDSLTESLKPQMDKLAQQWIKKNPEELKKIGRDPQTVAQKILREYYQSLIDSNSLLDSNVSPFTAAFGSFNPVTHEFKIGGLSQKSDPRVSDMMGLAPQAISAIDAGTYTKLLEREQKTSMALATETDMKSLGRQVKELQASAQSSGLSDSDRRYIEKELAAKRDALALAEDEARRFGLITKEQDEYLSPEESLQRLKSRAETQWMGSSQAYFASSEDADEFVASFPGTRRQGKQIVEIKKKDVGKAAEAGLLSKASTVFTEGSVANESGNIDLDTIGTDGTHVTMRAEFPLDDGLDEDYIQDIIEIAADEIGGTVEYNKKLHQLEVIKPHGTDGTEWGRAVTIFANNQQEDIDISRLERGAGGFRVKFGRIRSQQ